MALTQIPQPGRQPEGSPLMAKTLNESSQSANSSGANHELHHGYVGARQLLNATEVVRVAVIGDLHIGAQVDGCGSSAGSCQAGDSGHHSQTFSYYATEQFIDFLIRSEPDAVLITGDLFDRSDGSSRAIYLAQRLLEELMDGGRPIAVIDGNHDAESDLPEQLVLPESVNWFGVDHPDTLTWSELGLAVHGISVRERNDLRQVTASFPDPVPGAFNIAMLHTSLGGELSKRICLPVPLEQLQTDRRYEALALATCISGCS